MENSKNYTIKDIARMAGVSAGTVDRVLHNRGDVSEASMEKVNKVLKEIDYRPNMFAIGLAAKKRYRMLCVIPYCTEKNYWNSVKVGIDRAAKEFRPFNVEIDFCYYRHTDQASYKETCNRLQEDSMDGVLLAPNFMEETVELVRNLEQRAIPYVFVDFNVEHTHALCYIGQDSKISGYVAAKLLMRYCKEGGELAIFLNNQKENPAEIQMQRRLEGFMQYIAKEYSSLSIYDVLLHKEDTEANRLILDDFFEKHPRVMLGAAFNSRVFQVGNYLHETGKKLDGLIGYDLLPENVECLRRGDVNYLIGQRPGLQGYEGVRALCSQVVFKKPVKPVHYMPIDVLMKENIDFYFEI